MKSFTANSDISPHLRGRSYSISPSESQSSENSAAVQFALQSKHLLRGHKTVQIVHHDQVYVLQATRQGKLILTK